jgi:murein tripeptide amidase MpaA
LGGVEVPYLIITSRVLTDPDSYNFIKLEEFEDPISRLSIPVNKKKKQIVVDARVHPGESNASYMMQGFIRFLCGNSLQARELRKRCVFKIIPMVNVDGVIIGNYRTCYSGNDLNRKYHNPDENLHPTICKIKEIVERIT